MTETTTAPAVETAEAPELLPVRILVLQRGWAVVGRHHRDGVEHVLTDASVIRRWGTSRGIGEIALAGPTRDTVPDKAGTVRAHELATVLILDCDSAAWNGRL